MKLKRMILCMALLGVLVLAGCGKDTPAVTPTTAPTSAPTPTSTVVPTTEPTATVEPTEIPIYAGIPTLDQIAKDSLAQGKEYTGDALYGRGVEQLQKFWGKPNSMLSGLWGDIWHLDEERILIVYYNAEGIVDNFKIRECDIISTTTPVPTEQPKDDPTPIPTNAPVETEAPFAMVSPVPQNEVVDIIGTMTVETYPRVDGSTATLPLSEAVFMAATGESAEVAASEVVHTKTTNSYNRLYSGEVDLLIVYEPAEVIVERMKTEPLCIKPIGLDALVFLANTANPLQGLTMEQLVDIYSGKITNWAEVGGLDRELLAFQRPVNSGSQTLMQKLVMKDVPMVDGDNVFRYSTMSDILEGMLSYNNEDNTLGYSVFYYANNMYFEKDLKLMGVDGVLPSTRTIYDGSYKLTNAFYAVVRPDEPADSNARKIFDWLTGEAGQQLVLDLGYVPVQMPAGADISDAKVEQQQKVEILAKEPLAEGQYFVFVNPQNMVSDYYYGDMTVYNHEWKEIANFYNVTLNHGVQGVYTNRYLPVGQIRQSTDGTQKVLYGVYDLEQGTYSIAPSYGGMEMLDVKRGYYAVPPENWLEDDFSWMKWSIIDGTGKVILSPVEMSDWLTIYKFGNGYLEFTYDYNNWESGMIHRYYDENLVLKKAFYEKMDGMPDDADMIEGVDYILLDEQGCLVDADGEVVLNWATFLDRYGDGENMEVKTSFYNVTEAEEDRCYAVLYKKAVYLFDGSANLLRIIDNPAMVNAFDSADFYEKFCYYRDDSLGDWVYGAYEGETINMSNGMTPEHIETNWGNNGYLMYRIYNGRLFMEEYTTDGDLILFSVELPDTMKNLEVSYSENGYVMINQDCGEEVQSPYTNLPEMIPVYEKFLYYRGELVATGEGMNLDYMYDLSNGYNLWILQTGDVLTAESESVFEDYENIYVLADHVFVKENQVLYENDNSYLVSWCNDTVFLLKGNYVYAVGTNGTEYIRALHTSLNND